MAELEQVNATLLTELEWSRAALVEAETHQNSFLVNYAKLEEECACLRTVVDTLRHEKTEVVNEVTSIHVKF
jgi:hypothetical protein